MGQENVGGMFSEKFQTEIQSGQGRNKFVYRIGNHKYQHGTEFQTDVFAEKIGEVKQEQTGEEFACLYYFIV